MCLFGKDSSQSQRGSVSLRLLLEDPTQGATISRHRRAVHEVILDRLRRSEQLRGHLRPVGEAVYHLLR